MRNQLLKTDCRDMGAYLQAVRSRLFVVRNQPVLLAQDVAALYGVEPREVGQAIRNNPDKFPEGYVLDLTKEETEVLKSKVLTLKTGRGQHSKRGYKVLTERGLYMLATILKGAVATRATLAIIETYARVRGVKNELLELHKEKDPKKRSRMMRHFGETIADIVMPDLEAVETESSLELNFFIGKIKHTVRRIRKAPQK